MLKLVIEDDEGQQTVVPLVRDEITIGRAEGNTIRLTERNVSRRHARLSKVDSQIFIEDVAARYGIKHNGKKLESRAKFEQGDEVQIGDYTLTVQDESTKQVQAMDEPDGPQPIPEHRAGRLVVISSNYAGQEFPLTATEMVIGRTEDNDIIINHGSISRNHAKVVYNKASKTYRIEDVGSANGVKVNGRQTTSIELRSGDIVELGHVRFRYCEPGELWSFEIMMAHLQMMEEPIKAPGSTGKIIALVIIALLVVGATVFFVLSQGEDDAQAKDAKTTNKAATAVGPIGEIDPEKVEALIRECDSKLADGELQGALQSCRSALDMDPDNDLAKIKYKKALEENTLMQTYTSAKGLLEEGACQLALAELEKVDDPNTIVARKIKQDGLLEEAQACVEEALIDQVASAANDYDFQLAEDYLAELEQTAPGSTEIGSLKSLIEAKKEEYKENKKKRPKKSNGGGSDSGSKEPEMSADEKKAKFKESMDAGLKAFRGKDYGAAIDAYKDALKIKSKDVQALSSLALAYEKNGDVCKALKVYIKVLPKLSGRRQASTQKKVDKFTGECN